MLTNIRYVLLSALYDRLFLGLIGLVLFASGVSYLLGMTAFMEQTEMALTFTAASSRLILVVGVIVFVCFHIRSAFDSREMDVMLSRPISRDQVVLSHWLGFSLVSLLLVMPVLAILLVMGAPQTSGLFYWTLSLVLELWFVVAFAQFAAFILRSAVMAVMASLAFYVLARMIILFVMTAEHSTMGGNLLIVRDVVHWIAVIIPRMDLFAKSEWLIYGLKNPGDWTLFVAQAALYISILLVACILDFRKKQF